MLKAIHKPRALCKVPKSILYNTDFGTLQVHLAYVLHLTVEYTNIVM